MLHPLTDPHHTPTIIQPSTSQPQKTKQRRKPRRKVTEVSQPSDPTKHVADEAVNEEMDDSLERASTTATSLDAEQDIGAKKPWGILLLRLGLREYLKFLMIHCLQELTYLKVTTQALEIDSLKRRVKKLEKRKRSRTHGLKILYKVGLSARVESSKDEGLGEEDTSKQGRIADIDANEDITLVSTHDEDMFGVNDLDGDEVIVESVDVAEQAKEIFDDITLAKALMEIKTTSSRPKAKGLVIHEQEKAPTPIVSSQQPSQVKDKAEEEEEERLAREKAQQIEEVNIAWDDVQEKEKVLCSKESKRKKKQTTKSLKKKSFAKIQELFDKAMKKSIWVKMDDPNITIKEYIRLKEEKSQGHGRTFNWQTATFGKSKHYEDKDNCSVDFETEFPAIVFNNTIIMSEPKEYIRLKEEKSQGHGRTFNWQTATFGKSKHYEDKDNCSVDFETEFPAIVFNNTIIMSEPKVCPPNKSDLTSKLDLGIKPLISTECIDEIDLIDETSLSEYDEEIISRFNDLFNDIHPDDLKSRKDNDDNNIVRRCYEEDDMVTVYLSVLHTEREMAEAGFGVYLSGSDRLIPDKGDPRDYWTEISSDKDFLGPTPSYASKKVTGIDLFYLRSMEHRTINVPHMLVQYLFRHTKGKKSGARLLGRYFVRLLAMHFGLDNDEGLRGLQVVTRELLLIDLHKLKRIHICTRYDDTWAWVAQGPKRQQAAAAGTHKDDEAVVAAEEVAEDIPAPAPALAHAPPPVLQHQTISQRIERLKEEVCEIHRTLDRQREVMDTMARDLSRFTTWAADGISHLLDAAGASYTRYSDTPILYIRRRVRQRTGEASTSATPSVDDHPDP
nr:hypothetical protein [Tanacetum cinerariifolium]